MRILVAVSWVFLVALATSVVLWSRVETHVDDAAYLAIGNRLGAWTASMESYRGWSGRFVLNFLLFSAIASSWAWKSCMVGGLLLLGASMARLAVGSALPRVAGTALALAAVVCLTDRRVLFDGMWWVTGSFNYLLPVGSGLFAVGVLLHAHQAGPMQRAAGLIAAAIASYHEQMAVSLALTALGVLAWQTWHRSRAVRSTGVSRPAPGSTRFAPLFALVVAVNTAILLLAPGNRLRLAMETRTWFPAFAEFGLTHKLLLGVERLAAHLVTPATGAFHLLLLVTVIVLWQRRRGWGWAAWLPMAVLFGHALFMLLRRAPFGLPSPYPTLTIPNNATGLEVSAATHPGMATGLGMSGFAIFWVLLVVGSMLAVRLAMAASVRERCLAALPWAVAVGSVVMVGLSPTVYASGWRILYLADMMLVIAWLDWLRAAGWLAGRSGLCITGALIVGATGRMVSAGAVFFLR